MSRSLKLYITWLVGFSAGALLLTSFAFDQFTSWPLGMRPGIAIDISESPEADVLAGVAFWTVITLFAGALPVRMPRGTFVSVSIAPVIAAMALGGPVAAGWVALIGTTELREIRGEVPWYGTAANHAGMVLPAILGGLVMGLLTFVSRTDLFVSPADLFASPVDLLWQFGATMAGAVVMFLANVTLVAVVVALRSNQSVRVVVIGDAKGFATSQLALAPLAWLMAEVYISVAAWATLLFALPL